MLLSFRHPSFETPDQRKRFAHMLSCMIDGRGPEDSFSPYCPNEREDTYWTLDRGNDWKVTFYPEKPETFRIRYRYNGLSQDKESALAGWLVSRLGCEIVKETTIS